VEVIVIGQKEKEEDGEEKMKSISQTLMVCIFMMAGQIHLKFEMGGAPP